MMMMIRAYSFQGAYLGRGNLNTESTEHTERETGEEWSLSHQHRQGNNFSPEIQAVPEFSSFII